MTEKEIRKSCPVSSGVLKYFPDAIKEVAYTSWVGNEQHNPGEHLHWAKEKSQDEDDAMVRHLMDHYDNPIDDDTCLHLAKAAWRALGNLQRYLDKNPSMKVINRLAEPTGCQEGTGEVMSVIIRDENGNEVDLFADDPSD